MHQFDGPDFKYHGVISGNPYPISDLSYIDKFVKTWIWSELERKYIPVTDIKPPPSLTKIESVVENS